MAWTQMFLDFITALIWPAVVVTATVLFRRQIGELVGRIRSASGPAGVALTFDARGARDALELVEPVPTPDGEPDTTDVAPTRPAEDRVSMTRDDLQTLVIEFAEAGWEASRTLPFKDAAPSPRIGWSQDGRPRIEYWATRSPTQEQLSALAAAEAAADEAARTAIFAGAEYARVQEAAQRGQASQADVLAAQGAYQQATFQASVARNEAHRLLAAATVYTAS